MKFSFPRRKGQSLLESLVALSVLTMGLLGTITLLAQSFAIRRTISDQLIATYLAGEGIEIARDIIYHDVFIRTAFGTCLPAGTYDLDFATMESWPSQCPNTVNLNALKPLYFDPVATSPTVGMYGDKQSLSNGATATSFSRYMTISYPSVQEATVLATVIWGSNTYTLEDHFYNWHP